MDGWMIGGKWIGEGWETQYLLNMLWFRWRRRTYHVRNKQIVGSQLGSWVWCML